MRGRVPAEPERAARVGEALAAVDEQLRRAPSDTAALRDRLALLAALIAPVAGLTEVADGVRRWPA